MPLYYFNLKDGLRTTADREGTELPDACAAEAYAIAIARDILHNDGYRKLSCRLLVQDCDRNPCFELLFAGLAERLQMLPAKTREAIQARAGQVAVLNEDVRALHDTLRKIRATLARSDGRPHLAAINGRRVDS